MRTVNGGIKTDVLFPVHAPHLDVLGSTVTNVAPVIG